MKTLQLHAIKEANKLICASTISLIYGQTWTIESAIAAIKEQNKLIEAHNILISRASNWLDSVIEDEEETS